MKSWISIATSLMLIAPSTFAKGSVEAIQLQVVPLDTSIDCNRNFFESSSHFKNTIFVMPRIVQGSGPDSKRAIEIFPTSGGKYVMYLRLFFPTNDSYLKTSSTSAASVDRDACNFDEVKAALNEHISDPDKKINVIARMPLTNVEVSIPGIRESSAAAEQEDSTPADFEEYSGKSSTFIFNITPEEKEFIETQVVTLDGIPAKIKVLFQARTRDGSVQVEINSSKLQANFLAQAKGQVYMTNADVAVALRASMDESSINIVAEAGNSSSSESTINRVIDQILNNVALTADTKIKKKKSKESDDEEDTSKDDDSKDKEKDKDAKEADADTEDDSSEIANLSDSSSPIAVKAVLEAITKTQKSSFSHDQLTANESVKAKTEIRLRANRIPDANVQEIAIQASYQDPTVGVNIRAGQTVSIVPAYTFVDSIVYKERKTFITTNMINELDLAQYFDEITSSSMVIQNKIFNGTTIATGSWQPVYSPFATNSYRWAQIENIPVRAKGPARIYKQTLEELQKIPVAVSFTGLGDRWQAPLAKLIGTNNWWTARFDVSSGRLLITAKRDLGRITFRESMRGPENIATGQVISNKVVMESISILTGKVTPYKEVIFAQDNAAITKQRTIMINLSRPLSEQALADLDDQNQNPKELAPRKSTFEVRTMWWKIDPK